MKRISVLILFIYICSVPLSAQSVDKPLVTVMDFALSGISEAEGRLLVDFISNSVRETDRYRIIDRVQRDSILGEQEFSLSGCTDEKCQLEVGKLLSANLMFVGSIGKIGDRYILNMKLVDVATGETVGTASEKYNDLNMLVDDSNRLVLGMLGTGREILPAVESPQRDSEIQNTGTVPVPDSEFILFTPGKFFKPAYYTFRGEEYPFRYFQGFSSLMEELLWSAPSISEEFELMLEEYLENVKRQRAMEIGGICGTALGTVAILVGIGSGTDVLAGVGVLGYVGGIVLNIIGGIRMEKPPEEIVNYYNLRYAGR